MWVCRGLAVRERAGDSQALLVGWVGAAFLCGGVGKLQIDLSAATSVVLPVEG